MQFLATIVLPFLAALASVAGTPLPSPIMGTINAPTASSALVAENPFPFSYSVSNWCEEGYNSFSVFLTQGTSEPTFDDLDASGNPTTAVFSFGQFTVANFGLPQSGTPPPTELTMPVVSTISEASDDSGSFLTVVQNFRGCPGGVVQELGVASIPFVYDTTA
ncbi:hypothetical protein PHLCEN_2v5927 [Hermanssonia centrifuga]|uniref:Uncharacterized protein n=1 Tax=Hermanssonia centrifuga TaxID=98765 RepID=A0A2R6P0Z8_9APHY|nr:hypothetical protein PHLCEN_2v5927 [Hermanssonia centrifuga]